MRLDGAVGCFAGSVMGLYGVKRVEVMKVTTTADGSKLPYQVIFSAYFESLAGLQNAIQSPQIGPVFDDIQRILRRYAGRPHLRSSRLTRVTKHVAESS